MELTVALVGRAHGLDGEVLVRAETDDGPDVFRPGRRLLARPGSPDEPARELTIVSSRPHKGGFLLRFAEIDDREGARRLMGAELTLSIGELRPLDEGEFFLHQLVGLKVVDISGQGLGTVIDVYDTTGQLLAEAEIEGRRRLFPVRPETVGRIDLEAGVMEVMLPTGLLDI